MEKICFCDILSYRAGACKVKIAMESWHQGLSIGSIRSEVELRNSKEQKNPFFCARRKVYQFHGCKKVGIIP